MDNKQANNPLHGITLEKLLRELVNKHGWRKLGSQINIKCFTDKPSVKSSLKFLRKTDWARKKVENLYIQTFAKKPAVETKKTVWKKPLI